MGFSRVYQVSNPNPTLGDTFVVTGSDCLTASEGWSPFSREGDPGQGASSRGTYFVDGSQIWQENRLALGMDVSQSKPYE